MGGGFDIVHCDGLVHQEVLRLRYDDYAPCVSDHRLVRVKALLEAAGEAEAIMAMANIPLKVPQILVEVSEQIHALDP